MFRALPETIEPEVWYVAFHTGIRYWWQRFLPGKYKHVGAFAYIAALDLWVVYDLWPARTRILLVPHCARAEILIAEHTIDADIVKFRRTADRARLPIALFSCVSAVKHLLGLQSVAFSPSGLYRSIIKQGGEPRGRAREAGTRSSTAAAA